VSAGVSAIKTRGLAAYPEHVVRRAARRRDISARILTFAVFIHSHSISEYKENINKNRQMIKYTDDTEDEHGGTAGSGQIFRYIVDDFV